MVRETIVVKGGPSARVCDQTYRKKKLTGSMLEPRGAVKRCSVEVGLLFVDMC